MKTTIEEHVGGKNRVRCSTVIFTEKANIRRRVVAAILARESNACMYEVFVLAFTDRASHIVPADE